MSDDLQELRKEIAELRTRLEETDDYAQGVYKLLATVLPFLLQGHPEAEKIGGLLKSAADQHEALLKNPSLAVQGEPTAGTYEPSKMLYQLLALMGVWPGVDPGETAKASIERHRR